jgi:membrane protease YdiL (CAAX protease family)
MPALVSASAYLAGNGAGSFNDVAAGIAALAGLFLLVGGLVWLAVAGIVRRRVLGPDRYRGGSVIGLLSIVVIGGNLAALPILLLLLGGDANRLDDPFVVTVELLLTPASFLIVYALFIALPHALPGVQVWAGAHSLPRLLLGIGLGVGVWLALAVLSTVVNLVVEAVSGSPLGGEQAVAGLATQIPLVSAILAVAVLAPLAEELFFRGAVLNAWEREYGTSRAVIGSALLFALVHVAGGTALAVVQVFLLGLVLGAVYVRTRSLPTVMGLHGAFNLASVLVLFLVK